MTDLHRRIPVLAAVALLTAALLVVTSAPAPAAPTDTGPTAPRTDLVDGDDDDELVPPSLCVVYATEAGEWLTEDDIEPFQSASQTLLIEGLEERGIDVKIYTKELAAVRSVIGNATGDYGLNENYLITADAFVEYRILTEDAAGGRRKYMCNVTASSNSTAEVWGNAQGVSSNVDSETEGLRQCCLTAIANVWGDLMEEWRKIRERGHFFRVVIDELQDEDAGDVVYDAIDDIANEVRFISMTATRLELEVWSPLDLADVNKFYREVRNVCKQQGVKLSIVHLFRHVLIAKQR